MPPPPRRESRGNANAHLYIRASERTGEWGAGRRESERREKERRSTAPTLSYTLSTHAGAPPSSRDASALTCQSALLLSTHSSLLRPHHLLRLLGARISARARSCCYGRGRESGEITPAGVRTPTDA
ncbi:hypothetical protein HPB50_013235 [Hyalomma asiaticum]|uniref:Uncharacterized protein n=1 Tax=Hyalomma asiaticum TaxID=266040 RepID=A0ACB7TJY1_HYAAI|nr:hypothetical protein HPB50_013235 [Hyalomma asiaticum]